MESNGLKLVQEQALEEDIMLEAIVRSKLAGLYLVSPHGKLLASEDKTLIVKTIAFKQHLQVPIYIISKEETDEEDEATVWAKIVLAKPEELSWSNFQKLQTSHRITSDEVSKWGWKGKHLYSYHFQLLEGYLDEPYKCVYEKGVQNFVSEVEFIGEAPKEIGVQVGESLHPERIREDASLRGLDKREVHEALLDEDKIKEITPRLLLDMTDEELLKLHNDLHDTLDSGVNLEILVNAHLFIMGALSGRKLEHPEKEDELDAQSEKLVGRQKLLSPEQSLYDLLRKELSLPEFEVFKEVV